MLSNERESPWQSWCKRRRQDTPCDGRTIHRIDQKGRHQYAISFTEMKFNARLFHQVIRHVNHSCSRDLTHGWVVVIAPPIRFSVVEFSENRGNHVKVSTSLGLLLAHLGFLCRPVDLLPQERYTTCSSLLPPKKVCICFHVNTQTHVYVHLPTSLPTFLSNY